MRVIIILMTLLLACPAQAADYYRLRGSWHISWSGIPFAKTWIAVEEDATGYRLTASHKSRGLARLFDKNKSTTVSHGARVGDSVQAIEYAYENKEENKRTLLRFDRGGELVRREVSPEDDPAHRPPVASTAVRGAATPGDALFALRQAVRTALDAKETAFTVRLYEGKRLMEVTGRILDDEWLDKRQVTRIELSRRLLGGFTAKETARYAEGEPPVYLLLDRETLFPLAMEAEIKFGTLRAVWRGE